MNTTINEEINEKKPGQFINSKIQYTILREHCKDHELSDQISIRLNLTYDSPIESTYFSWRLKKFDKIIYPLCEYCKNNGKTWHKRTQKKIISSNNDSEEENNE
ncbi:24619_t:CDS:2, partial [Racocetra persica]